MIINERRKIVSNIIDLEFSLITTLHLEHVTCLKDLIGKSCLISLHNINYCEVFKAIICSKF